MGKPRKPKQPAAIMRPLDPSDPRSLDHPCHDQQWLELTGTLGKALAGYVLNFARGGPLECDPLTEGLVTGEAGEGYFEQLVAAIAVGDDAQEQAEELRNWHRAIVARHATNKTKK
jgi:hypothetical protein